MCALDIVTQKGVYTYGEEASHCASFLIEKVHEESDEALHEEEAFFGRRALDSAIVVGYSS